MSNMGLNTFLHKWMDGAYCVGIVEGDVDKIVTNGKLPEIHWIQPESDDIWMADPFIIDATSDTITLLVEEFVIAQNKGRLSKIIVDRNTWRIISVTPILEQPTHLSFPFPITKSGKTYLCPESNAANEVALYEFDGLNCTKHQIIIKGKMLDTQIVENGGGATRLLSEPPVREWTTQKP